MLIDTRPDEGDRADPVLPPADAITLTAGVSLAAAVIHAVAAPGHYREAALYGVLFGIVAAAQFGWAVILYTRPRRRSMRSAALGNALVASGWLIGHTVGLPFAPGDVETIGVLGLLATLDETFLILSSALLPAVVTQGTRGDRRRYEYAAIGLCVVSLTAVMLAGGHH